MRLLEEAKRVLEADPERTVPTYNRLLELQSQADGIEVTLIGDLIEGFLSEASLSVLKEITKANPKSLRSGWGF